MRTFVCACCDEEFESVTTDEELRADFKQRYPESDIDPIAGRDHAHVCEDCHQRFQRWLKTRLN